MRTVKLPPRDTNHQLKDPADLPLLRRYQAVTRMMRRGATEEEAIQRYDQPRGVCNRVNEGVPCGAAAPGDGRVCAKCRAAEQALRQKDYRAGFRHWVDQTCKACSVVYHGHRDSGYCPEHKPGKKGKRVARKVGRPKKVAVKRVARPVVRPSALPPSWTTVPTQKLPANEPTEWRIVVPKDVEVKVLPSTVPDRRNW